MITRWPYECGQGSRSKSGTSKHKIQQCKSKKSKVHASAGTNEYRVSQETWYLHCCAFGTGSYTTNFFINPITIKINKQLPAVISSCTYHILVIMRKADVGNMRRMPKIPLVFGLLEKEEKFRT